VGLSFLDIHCERAGLVVGEAPQSDDPVGWRRTPGIQRVGKASSIDSSQNLMIGLGEIERFVTKHSRKRAVVE
jgi:hypothetical protein